MLTLLAADVMAEQTPFSASPLQLDGLQGAVGASLLDEPRRLFAPSNSVVARLFLLPCDRASGLR